ncbi:hypothetical protein IM816_13085 [Luteibacter flocculans]|uniref:Uncharacterized protein n=1 Tax=Luteibacter flocculans TaxID=2780091 RepID=A0ABY4T0F1_9GAMM|nr:hypothetical protein [Luteibacter flocculans]URL57552.1 hypothetical protein IM816_13085 [Luteibacter flocculans]
MKAFQDSKINVRPSLIVFVLYGLIAFTLVGFGLWALTSQHPEGRAFVGYAIGSVSLAIGLGFGRDISELCSVRIDDEGISQWKIMRRRRVLSRDCVRWEDRPAVVDDGLRAVVKSASTEIRINLSFFADMHGVFALIERLAHAKGR